MFNFITAENLVGIGIILSLFSLPMLYLRSNIVTGCIFIVWMLTGGWCGYLLYCLMQIPDMTGYHMFG